MTYPQIVTEGPSSETLLRSLWKHVNNYYFKKIEDQEYDRLNYISSIVNSQVEGNRHSTQKLIGSRWRRSFTLSLMTLLPPNISTDMPSVKEISLTIMTGWSIFTWGGKLPQPMIPKPPGRGTSNSTNSKMISKPSTRPKMFLR